MQQVKTCWNSALTSISIDDINLLKMNNVFFVLCLSLLFLVSCGSDDNNPGPSQTVYGQFEVQPDNSIIMDGDISLNTSADLAALIVDHPEAKLIIMKNSDGIHLDDVTLEAARLVRSAGMDTHLASDGVISRGGLNFFIAGVNRTMDAGGQMGVGAWRDAMGNEATSYGFGDDAHLRYLNFYAEMGYQWLDGSNFYFFSIQAADSNNLFFLTDDLIEEHQLLTN